MKRFTAFVFVTLLTVALALTSFAAEYTVGSDGNAVYDTAIGYYFRIDDVNGAIEGEDATVITNNEALANVGSKWAIWFVAKQEAGDIYQVTTNGTAMGGTIPAINLKSGEIFVAVHSSSSRPTDAALYPNWEDKVAALAVKAGDWLAFENTIDLANGTGSGRMLVLTKDDVLAGLIEFPYENPSDEPVIPPADDSSIPEESDNASDDNAQEEASAESEEIKQTEIITDNDSSIISVSTDTGVSDPNAKDSSWFDSWKWVIIGFAGGFLVVALVLFLRKPAKKAAETEEAPAESGEQAPESNEENKAE